MVSLNFCAVYLSKTEEKFDSVVREGLGEIFFRSSKVLGGNIYRRPKEPGNTDDSCNGTEWLFVYDCHLPRNGAPTIPGRRLKLLALASFHFKVEQTSFKVQTIQNHVRLKSVMKLEKTGCCNYLYMVVHPINREK